MSSLLPAYSIKALYGLALAEGEGMGTAYEYYAKRLLLAHWLKGRFPIRTILVAGLPERYGSSLDFLLLAADCGAQVTVVDERPQAIERLEKALSSLRRGNNPAVAEPMSRLTTDTAALQLPGEYDLALSSEVIQRLTAETRSGYLRRLSEVATLIAVFTPNADNPGHTGHSGLAGLHLEELQALLQEAGPSAATGFVDMPPFPPGITRTETQRAQASTGLIESLAMRGLGLYAHIERLAPSTARRRQSHIIYALAPG